MKPPEEDGYWPQEDIDRIAGEMGDEFDELGKDHPGSKRINGSSRLVDRPVGDGIEQKEPQESVPDQCRWHQCGQMHGISAPWLLAVSGQRLLVSAKTRG